MKRALVILIATALATAAPQKPNRLNYRNLFKTPIGKIEMKPRVRIIGGQEAEPHSIPSQAFLEGYSESKGWWCGGSLISQNHILTAAHCCAGALEIHVRLGAHRPFESEDTQILITSKEYTIHEDYDSAAITNDVAVIKLPEAVTLTPAIQTVALPSKADAQNTYEGVTARVSGWGLTDGFGKKLSDVLNYVDVPIISNKECSDRFNGIIDSILCTSGRGNIGSCSGDSGGPLIVENVQIGVVSFGVMYCFPGYPSGFSRITSFLDWLEKHSDAPIS